MKIAFCFLTYDNLVRTDIWNQYFKDVDPNKYIVYIHPKKTVENQYTFPYNIIKNIIQTRSKDHISVVQATLQLFREAYSEEVSHFIFLSQSCIPLYSFDIIYYFLKLIEYSIISCILNNKKDRYFSMSEIMKKHVTYSSFVKQQPNMILVNSDVKLLIQNDMTHHFKNMSCPDEHYFINLLLFICNKKIIHQQIDFCNFSLNKTQAIEFHHVDSKLIRNIRSLGFLFMRKVTLTGYVDNHFIFYKK